MTVSIQPDVTESDTQAEQHVEHTHVNGEENKTFQIATFCCRQDSVVWVGQLKTKR